MKKTIKIAISLLFLSIIIITLFIFFNKFYKITPINSIDGESSTLIIGNESFISSKDHNQEISYAQNNSCEVIYLGVGNSFDVSKISGYNEFTSDNFIVSINPTNKQVGWEDPGGVGNHYVMRDINSAKNYDASTGVFTCSAAGGYSNNSGDTRLVNYDLYVYLIVNLSSLKNLSQY